MGSKHYVMSTAKLINQSSLVVVVYTVLVDLVELSVSVHLPPLSFRDLYQTLLHCGERCLSSHAPVGEGAVTRLKS